VRVQGADEDTAAAGGGGGLAAWQGRGPMVDVAVKTLNEGSLQGQKEWLVSVFLFFLFENFKFP